MNVQLCTPALLYLVFSLIQVMADTWYGLYNTAVVKSVTALLITAVLQALCHSGMGVLSWILVFLPFVFLSAIVTLLLFVFQWRPTSGTVTTVKIQAIPSFAPL